ncbi:MarR family transcriptional regulator [Pseudoponticoccus marisrubri]|uniref:MarR family transcriptional regulator n=2 Tax=Pseudoponticoccus marisrubri TaxID=1685382 RepID=A0A0W7WIB4_9RHOB|nr:MarR family transcriptional regulator [Pseudoponticoccus marisrubri]
MEGLPEFDLTGFTPYRAAVAAQFLSERLAREYRSRFGISIPDWRVLVHLAHSGGASVRDIENAVVMEKSKVSRTASRLESRGLIAKRPQARDRRLVHLTLTEEGRALMRELLPLAAAFQAKLESVLGADFESFDRTLGRLIEMQAGEDPF